MTEQFADDSEYRCIVCDWPVSDAGELLNHQSCWSTANRARSMEEISDYFPPKPDSHRLLSKSE